jgi:hypothetical protein
MGPSRRRGPADLSVEGLEMLSGYSADQHVVAMVYC